MFSLLNKVQSVSKGTRVHFKRKIFYKPLVFSPNPWRQPPHHHTCRSQWSGSHSRHVQNQVDQVLKIYRSPLSPFVVGGSPINGSDAFSVAIVCVLSVVPPQLYQPVNQPCQLPALPLLSLISRSCSSSSTM